MFEINDGIGYKLWNNNDGDYEYGDDAVRDALHRRVEPPNSTMKEMDANFWQDIAEQEAKGCWRFPFSADVLRNFDMF